MNSETKEIAAAAVAAQAEEIAGPPARAAARPQSWLVPVIQVAIFLLFIGT